MPRRCDHCGRRLDRPTWDESCPQPHAPATLADVIVRAVERQACGWRGALDDDERDQVRDRARAAVSGVLDEYLGGSPT